MHCDGKVDVIVLDISLLHLKGRTKEFCPKKVSVKMPNSIIARDIYPWSFITLTVSDLLGLGNLSRQKKYDQTVLSILQIPKFYLRWKDSQTDQR